MEERIQAGQSPEESHKRNHPQEEQNPKESHKKNQTQEGQKPEESHKRNPTQKGQNPKESRKRNQAQAEQLADSALFRRRELQEKHESYAREREMYNAIQNGDMSQIAAFLDSEPDGTPGILSRDRLRNSKNIFIASITLCTRAAIDGGLAEETAYAMSDGFIQRMEACVQTQEIDELYRHAVTEFTKAVARDGKPHYSSYVEQAIHYIHIHLHTDIRLEDTARAAGVNPCYLSHIFHVETGITMADYIQRERIEAARHLLIYSDFTATEISQYLCFSTQSYFIRIFKKVTGMTPGRYRRFYRTNGKW